MFIDQRIKDVSKLMLLAAILLLIVFFIPIPIIHVAIYSFFIWIVGIFLLVLLKLDNIYSSRFGSISYLVIFYSLLILYYVIFKY